MAEASRLTSRLTGTIKVKGNIMMAVSCCRPLVLPLY